MFIACIHRVFSKARFSYEFRFTLAPARKSIRELTAGQIWGSANAHKNVCTECNNADIKPTTAW